MDDEFKQYFMEIVKDGAVSNFAKDKEIRPVLLLIQQNAAGEKGLVAMDLAPLMNPDGKDTVAQIIQEARTVSPSVALITESWMSKKERKPDTKENEILAEGISPSEDPNRIEIVSIMFYFGLESKVMWAEIIRPEKGNPFLANWTEPNAMELKGRFAKPPPSWS